MFSYHNLCRLCFIKVRFIFFRAVDFGISGLPSFQVDDGPVVFGQDRLNLVEDMLLGWDFDLLKIPNSKL